MLIIYAPNLIALDVRGLS